MCKVWQVVQAGGECGCEAASDEVWKELFAAPSPPQILFEETLYQNANDGTPFVKILQNQGIIPGIKVPKPFRFLQTCCCWVLLLLLLRVLHVPA